MSDTQDVEQALLIDGLREELRRQSQELERAREIVRRIGEGHNPHRKCLAPSKCCPKNRLCFPCLANDFLEAQKKEASK
jgi:hypothetical protein